MPRLASPSIAILVLRIVLLVIASGAVVAGFLVTRRKDGGTANGGASFVCPMHPEATSASPGDCPICRMALEPKAFLSATSAATASGSNATGDSAPIRFVLPPGAEIQTFDEIGYGKLHETSREMRAPAWTETREVGFAHLYRDEIALLEPTEAGLFYPATKLKNGRPSGIKVQRVDEPPRPWDGATSVIRFRVDAKSELIPDQTGWVKFATRVRQVPAVRASAVIQSPTGSYVFLVAKDNRTLTKRPIEIGSISYGQAAVLSGLAVGERVAALNTFFLDAERRFAGSPPK